jgi:hypothetical protein
MAILEIDHLVRSTGITIIVIFIHAYLIAEKGTGYELANEVDEEEEGFGQQIGGTGEEESLSQPRLSTQTDVSSTE